MAASVALVLCSGREGLARSIMEALALGGPGGGVKCARQSRAGRRLRPDRRGRGHRRPCADAMDWLLDHPVERRAMGERGRIRMVEGYDLRVVTRLHEDLYASMLAERSVAVRRGQPVRPADQSSIERPRSIRPGPAGAKSADTGQGRTTQPIAEARVAGQLRDRRRRSRTRPTGRGCRPRSRSGSQPSRRPRSRRSAARWRRPRGSTFGRPSDSEAWT